MPARAVKELHEQIRADPMFAVAKINLRTNQRFEELNAERIKQLVTDSPDHVEFSIVNGGSWAELFMPKQTKCMMNMARKVALKHGVACEIKPEKSGDLLVAFLKKKSV